MNSEPLESAFLQLVQSHLTITISQLESWFMLEKRCFLTSFNMIQEGANRLFSLTLASPTNTKRSG